MNLPKPIIAHVSCDVTVFKSFTAENHQHLLVSRYRIWHFPILKPCPYLHVHPSVAPYTCFLHEFLCTHEPTRFRPSHICLCVPPIALDRRRIPDPTPFYNEIPRVVWYNLFFSHKKPNLTYRRVLFPFERRTIVNEKKSFRSSNTLSHRSL